MTDQALRPRWALVIAIVAGLFGLLTIKSGGEVLFFDGAGRAAAGDFVPFVLWFNFLAGFAYLATAIGLALWRPWAAPLSFTIAGLTVLVFAAFAIHIWSGQAFETRTISAMSLRSLVWLSIAFTLRGKFDHRLVAA
ncbi:MAG: hypothetical protein JKY27_04245 [Magnetovibrio sp.]|nr:hypothetical protein [Magnetovibrio sp.]